MARFSVTIEETIQTTYLVDADTAEAAHELWESLGDECGVIDWSVTKSSRVLNVAEDK